ncbi:NUDIX domain-containing protein [Falsibacillus pallidus]|uniref:ADP-ribose pyrophosphatase YjhB (NUDIX family) n=1 Tax=Falsibacillus pallidus TaxID=493781 RepID=A0A370GCC7_9BACI|nr:NUDIX domain-containing protein [Falsibacillus pallidus]RDI41475.1 ADP-ribose pyrophosphatase YjhB (NUDIX family) [Falsibacillus pallidus]
MGDAKRGNVWLGVSGLVVDENGRWLVVKKKYSGLKGKWSFPAGFVKNDETADEAVMREVLEETGIDTSLNGLIGLRTGVIKGEISDNMLLFALSPLHTNIKIQHDELMDVQWMHPDALLQDPNASVLLHKMAKEALRDTKQLTDGINPGDQFGYTAYKLFL